MELKELFLFRETMLESSRDNEGYISDADILENCLTSLNDTKYIDSTDVSNTYDPQEGGSIKVNAYLCNESGERLQLFVVNEDSLDPKASEEHIMVSQKAVYDKQLNRALSFLKKSAKKQLSSLLHDGSPAWVLVHQLSNPDFLEQIDVVEIFLISMTATVESRGISPSAKMLEFEVESISVSYVYENQKKTKEITIIKRLIDLNFLYNVQIAEGSRYPLVIDFSEPPFHPIPFLHAASEKDFDSYLCALPAKLLAELYKKHSNRLLEKNVRSFLQLKGVNKGMQETIRSEPEKFIAYNNGLTITATAMELTEHSGTPCIRTLSDFQIVNGGQTTATIYFSHKAGLPVDAIQVMAKINVAKNASEEVLDELISKISTFSNAQSKVSKVDLRARSTQLIKLKALSESVLTVSGKKWFFERAKGEYATMIRINSAKKSQIEKAYPKERRFTKEDLAKYHSSWGDKPYAVKKGGEKIFRLFLEEISGEGKSRKYTIINRGFYEDLIARMILFRSLEKMYGYGNSAIGQLRSAVVPYSISALYQFTTGGKKTPHFDLLKIWKAEKIDDDLAHFFKALMRLINKLIKKYSKSDDVGEYSKKQELWDDIADSTELYEFMTAPDHKAMIKKYSISAEEMKKREKEASSIEIMNFEPLRQMADIFDRGLSFYKLIDHRIGVNLSDSKQLKLNEIMAAIRESRVIDDKYLQFEKELIKTILADFPELLDSIPSGNLYANTVEFIVKKYNSAITSGNSIEGTFSAVREMADRKGIRNCSVFGEIGKRIQNDELPSILQVLQASEYVNAG